jgi:hypothetical protein
MAKTLSKAAQNRAIFDEFKDMGAGMQDGGRGETMDFIELHLLLENCELVPKYLSKDQAYEVYLDFLDKDSRGDSAEQEDGVKGKAKKEELDFQGFGRFMLHLVDILGFGPLLEREAKILREEMDKVKLRCRVKYEYGYRTVAAPRTLTQVPLARALCTHRHTRSVSI